MRDGLRRRSEAAALRWGVGRSKPGRDSRGRGALSGPAAVEARLVIRPEGGGH